VNCDKIVVYDTNVYRQLSNEAFEDLFGREQKANIIALANVWVARELLAHLADQSDPSFSSCRRALERLYRHCFNAKDGTIRFIPEAMAHIKYMLFPRDNGAWRKAADEHIQIISKLVSDVYGQKSNDLLEPALCQCCGKIASDNKERKEAFRNIVPAGLNHGSTPGKFISNVIVLAAMNEVGYCASPEKIQMAEEFCAIPVESLIEIIKVRKNTVVPEKFGNYLVDFDLLFCSAGCVKDIPVVLITDDLPPKEIFSRFAWLAKRIIARKDYAPMPEEIDLPDVPRTVEKEVVYHYTTRENFEKIFSGDSPTLHLSHISSMNDPSEFDSGIDEVQASLRSVDSSDANYCAVVDNVCGQMKNFKNNSWFIASFSSFSDDLSQWRAYGQRGHGIVIGFKVSALQDISNQSMWLWGRCNYDERDKKECYCRAHRLWWQMRNSGDALSKQNSPIAFLAYALFSKHLSYKAEGEVRLITSPKTVPAFKDGIKPYVALALTKGAIDCVRIGPCFNSDAAKYAIESFLRVKGYSVPVYSSAIPFREKA